MRKTFLRNKNIQKYLTALVDGLFFQEKPKEKLSFYMKAFLFLCGNMSPCFTEIYAAKPRL